MLIDANNHLKSLHGVHTLLVLGSSWCSDYQLHANVVDEQPQVLAWYLYIVTTGNLHVA